MLPALNSVNHRLYTYKNFSFSDIKKKEVLRMKHLYSFVCPTCLGKADSLRRTNTCACAALCASISINHVALCTLRDSLNGALTSTCSTRNAIFTNYVCHNSYC